MLDLVLAGALVASVGLNLFLTLRKDLAMTSLAQLQADIAAQTTETGVLTALAPQVVAAFNADFTSEDQQVVANTAAVAAAVALLQPLVPAPPAPPPAPPAGG